jgi:hypothetical protein
MIAARSYAFLTVFRGGAIRLSNVLKDFEQPVDGPVAIGVKAVSVSVISSPALAALHDLHGFLTELVRI